MPHMKTLVVHRQKEAPRGFTLIEIMVVVAILAILAAIAYPSYIESVRKSRRAEARGQLLEAAQYMQRFYSQNERFDKDLSDTATTLPPVLAQSPRQGTATYKIGFVDKQLTASSFELEAVPTGTMAEDRCGTLQITSTGRKSTQNAASGASVDDCWR